MKSIDKDNCIISIDVIPNNELISLILSFGSDVEVLEPISLREEIAKIVKENYKKYFAVQKGCIAEVDFCTVN